MRILKLPVVFILASIIFCCCGSKKQDAIAYNDLIIKYQSRIAVGINELYAVLENENINSKLDNAYQAAIFQVENSRDSLVLLGKFDKTDGLLQESALKLFEVYHSVLHNEMNEMINIAKAEKSNEIFDNRFSVLNTTAMKKMDDGLNEFQQAQKKFAEKYHFNFTQE